MDYRGVLGTPYEIASLVWQWGWQNLVRVNGRILRSGWRWTELSAEEFYAFVYTLMEDEAGGHTQLEETLQEWAAERVLATPSTTEISWAQADALALSLLSKTE